jgi:Domain of unknown function (DUF4123)
MRSAPAPKRAFLRVALGPDAARRVVLSPGDVVRVGRSEDADFSLARDRRLANIHFEIDWDGTLCHVRSRDEGCPTYVAGVSIRKAYAPNGSSLRAGDTFFTVHFEDHTPSKSPRPAHPSSGAALAALRAETHLWAVLDAARDDRILQLVKESADEARHLYEGPPGDAMADVAPYLVRFRPDSGLLERLVHEGWGRAWGIYFAWDASTKDVRRHLRRFLQVLDEEERERLYFRFYDPRVLEMFVPTCSVRQLATLFGDIERFHFEGRHGEVRTLERNGYMPGASDTTGQPDGRLDAQPDDGEH